MSVQAYKHLLSILYQVANVAINETSPAVCGLESETLRPWRRGLRPPKLKGPSSHNRLHLPKLNIFLIILKTISTR